jgi:hypothetical protein
MKRFASFFALLALVAQSLQPAFASGFSTVGGASGPTTLTGDVTGSGTGTVPATIPAGTITLTKQANLAANSIIGNNTGAGATPLALTTAQTKSLLAIANTDVSGLGTASTANTGTSGHTLPFLDGANTFSADQAVNGNLTSSSAVSGTARAINVSTLNARAELNLYNGGGVAQWALWMTVGSTDNLLHIGKDISGTYTDALTFDAPTLAATFAGTVAGTNLTTGGFPASVATGTIVGRSAAGTGAASALTVLPTAAMPALTGDVTNSAGSLGTTIAANAVSYAKMQSVTAARLLGNPTGSGAVPSEISLAGGLGFSGTTLTAAGALTPTSVPPASPGLAARSSAQGQPPGWAMPRVREGQSARAPAAPRASPTTRRAGPSPCSRRPGPPPGRPSPSRTAR